MPITKRRSVATAVGRSHNASVTCHDLNTNSSPNAFVKFRYSMRSNAIYRSSRYTDHLGPAQYWKPITSYLMRAFSAGCGQIIRNSKTRVSHPWKFQCPDLSLPIPSQLRLKRSLCAPITVIRSVSISASDQIKTEIAGGEHDDVV